MYKFLTFILIIFPATTFAQGFDCTKASNETERTICQSDELKKLDVELNRVYNLVLKNGSDYIVRSSKEAQRRWIEQRNLFGRDEKKLIRLYHDQITDWQAFTENSSIAVRNKEIILPSNGKMILSYQCILGGDIPYRKIDGELCRDIIQIPPDPDDPADFEIIFNSPESPLKPVLFNPGMDQLETLETVKKESKTNFTWPFLDPVILEASKDKEGVYISEAHISIPDQDESFILYKIRTPGGTALKGYRYIVLPENIINPKISDDELRRINSIFTSADGTVFKYRDRYLYISGSSGDWHYKSDGFDEWQQLWRLKEIAPLMSDFQRRSPLIQLTVRVNPMKISETLLKRKGFYSINQSGTPSNPNKEEKSRYSKLCLDFLQILDASGEAPSSFREFKEPAINYGFEALKWETLSLPDYLPLLESRKRGEIYFEEGTDLSEIPLKRAEVYLKMLNETVYIYKIMYGDYYRPYTFIFPKDTDKPGQSVRLSVTSNGGDYILNDGNFYILTDFEQGTMNYDESKPETILMLLGLWEFGKGSGFYSSSKECVFNYTFSR